MKLYDYTVKKVDESEVSLKEYEGKVMLIVNTATGCGFTPQYDGLESLYKKYKDKGFEILDFPSNQFFNQAPGTNEEIVNFCKVNFGTTFETFAKIDVIGDSAHPLYKYLKKHAPNDMETPGMVNFLIKMKDRFSVHKHEIQWNFTKFLIDREGNIVGRFPPTMKPEELEPFIEKVL